MSNPVLLPSLSENGWVSDPLNQANYLMSYFYESDFSQTQFYYGTISSMGYLLYLYGTDPARLASEVESNLLAFLSRFLNGVVVECSSDLANDTSQASINIYMSFLDKSGNTVTLSNMLLVKDSKIVQVINNANTGVTSGNPI